MSSTPLLFSVMPGGWKPFIPVYPGNKAHARYRKVIFGGRFQWGAIVEPFAGTGSTALYGRTESRILAESAPDVRAIWSAWVEGDWGYVQDGIRSYQRMPTQEAWDTAKAVYAQHQGLQLAAASLVLRKLAFGGVIRHGANGELNVSWHESKAMSFRQWKAPAPHATGKVMLYDDALQCLRESPEDDALVVIDPPYWLPGTGRMTPAYRAHTPHGDDTFALCVDALVLALPWAKRIVVCNYESPQLHEAILALAPHAKWVDFGVMDRMNNGNGEAKVKANERFWVIENNG